jgi:hypothetical protein
MSAIGSYSWTTTASGYWSVGGNWSPLGPPTFASTVVINPIGSPSINAWDDIASRTVTLDNQDPNADVQIGFGAATSATLIVTKGSTNAGEIEVRDNGNLVLRGTLNNAGGLIQADAGFASYNVELENSHITGGSIVEQSDAGIEVLENSTIKGASISTNESDLGITGGSTLTLDDTSVDGTSRVGFDSTGNTLVIGVTSLFQGTIYGLAGNTIDLTHMAFANLTIGGESLGSNELTLDYGHNTVNLGLVGNYVAAFNPPAGEPGFQISADATGGTLISYVASPLA